LIVLSKLNHGTRCRAAKPLKWEVSFLLIQAEAASRLGLIQALANLKSALRIPDNNASSPNRKGVLL
jgi:hypothetical protein